MEARRKNAFLCLERSCRNVCGRVSCTNGCGDEGKIFLRENFYLILFETQRVVVFWNIPTLQRSCLWSAAIEKFSEPQQCCPRSAFKGFQKITQLQQFKVLVRERTQYGKVCDKRFAIYKFISFLHEKCIDWAGREAACTHFPRKHCWCQ